MICTAERPHRVVDKFLNAARHVVVLDYLANRTTAKAELVLPTGTFAETDGTLVNNEGRAQRSFAVFPPGEEYPGKLALAEGRDGDSGSTQREPPGRLSTRS